MLFVVDRRAETVNTSSPFLHRAIAFFIVSGVLLLSGSAFAQRKQDLPGGLSQNSSVAEIVAWLDRTTFPKARIVLKDSWDDSTYRPPMDDTPAAKQTFIFTPGFRVTNIDGCNLLLRNDQARTVTKSNVDNRPPIVAEVWVQLNRMSADRGQHTHRFTNNPEKTRLLGAWRTNFKYSGWSSRTIVGLKLNSTDWKEPQKWEGMDLAFTFDTEEMSKNFDAAFRQAIRLCRSK